MPCQVPLCQIHPEILEQRGVRQMLPPPPNRVRYEAYGTRTWTAWGARLATLF